MAVHLDFPVPIDTLVSPAADFWRTHWPGMYLTEIPQMGSAAWLDVHLTVRFEPGTMSVVTGKTSSDGHEETFDLSLPNELDREHVIPLRLLDQPMEVRFKKMRIPLAAA